MLVPFAVWQGNSEEARGYRDDVLLALERTPHPDGGAWTQDAMARQMGISPQLLSLQLCGVRPFDLWKMALMPAKFHVELHKLRLARLAHEVLSPGELMALVEGVRRLVRLGESVLRLFGRRRLRGEDQSEQSRVA